jgi:hypothetical protein
MPPRKPQPTPQRVDIPTAEYTQRRHAAELCRWINEKFEALKSGGRFDEQYFERLGLNVKKLIEEAVPLSRLGLFLWSPGREVYVACLADNRNYDGQIEIEGYKPGSFKVEVTTTETDESAWRRQAFSREGFSTLAGPMRKEKRTAIPEIEMIKESEESEKYAAQALDRLKKKIQSESYDGSTAILVYLSQVWPLPAEGRAQLIRETTWYLERERPQVPAVYYCYSGSYSIDCVRV